MQRALPYTAMSAWNSIDGNNKLEVGATTLVPVMNVGRPHLYSVLLVTSEDLT